MKKIKFELQIYCTVGWDDDEDIATLEVDHFEQILEVVSILDDFERSRGSNRSQEVLQAYNNIKEDMKSNSGEEIMMLGGVVGIQCSYEDSMGIRAEMALSDNFGIDGSVTVNSSEHENEYKRLLADAKKLATSIVKL
ncbi:hypothetical protein [Sporosarcina sp. FSL W7-1283]|uniref:hypothetical protein n=1 Tax=Sporosarcina sp. FSL W7-1283 TaxID=2921560 RepID=UPI0030F80834